MKTAEELGITQDEFDGLQAVEAGLRSGKYVHVENLYHHHTVETKPIFNMAAMFDTHDCGQAGCIGGWLALQMGLNAREACDYVARNSFEYKSLEPLFYPSSTTRVDYEAITPLAAANAIRDFLNTGIVDWDVAIAEAA